MIDDFEAFSVDCHLKDDGQRCWNYFYGGALFFIETSFLFSKIFFICLQSYIYSSTI